MQETWAAARQWMGSNSLASVEMAQGRGISSGTLTHRRFADFCARELVFKDKR